MHLFKDEFGDPLYRPAVGMMLLNAENKIFVGQRIDSKDAAWQMPQGGIESGEEPHEAALRELFEESGAHCNIKRFLGCLEYSFEPGHSSICHNHEYNFIFEAESESLKSNHKIPQLEKHIELIWLPLHQLSEIDFRAEPLRELVPQWLKTPASDVFRSVMI